MVFGVSLIPSIMGCHDGTLELCLAPDVDTTSAFYGGIFWIHSSDSVFQPGCKLSSHREAPLTIRSCLTDLCFCSSGVLF